ncbi:hypothetical protein J1N35_001041 [Gossypium stocksii]|uniref:Uncharacterized protein n=1 Tax=Gossypium stocksii TaxID=47602 RepID=A0A9D4ALA7_9ROSI|nr:hypothetical protein J1N35_001041 [Gossypium stocksii]
MSDSHSEGGLGRVPAENGHIGLVPKFKQCKVSTVRDFSLGCSRMVAPITRPSEQATSD